jgi:hypothetical protein
MTSDSLDRRAFLKSTGTAAGIVILGGSIMMASDGAWALSLVKLDTRQGATLIRMARDLCPHDAIDDGPYAKVVEGLDAEAAKDEKTAALLGEGVKKLDASAGGNYAGEPEDKRLAALGAAAGSPFFQKVQSAMIDGFYNNQEVWAKLGYEGSSAEKGGYIHRGFDDLAWLPKS